MPKPSQCAAPHNLEAERALLGSILLDNGALYLALDRLTQDDFFSDAHRITFARMCELAGTGKTVDLVTLSEELSRRGLIQKAGGEVYLAALTDGVPIGSAVSVVEYARIVKEKSLIRRLVKASNSTISRCLEGADDSEELIAEAQAQLLDITGSQDTKATGPRPIAEIICEAMPVLEKTVGSGVMAGMSWGYAPIDKFTAGLHAAELVILAARPSMGKTALGLGVAMRVARAGEPVGIFSLEMSKESLLLRMACWEAKLDSHKLRSGWLNKDELTSLMAALAKLSKLPIWIDDTPGLTIEQLQWRLRSLAKQASTRLVIVDYLQLISARAENRTQEITRVSIGLKNSARELGSISNGTLVALAQLSRLAAGEEPQLHHLRESGQIEQDADVVMFLWDEQRRELGDPSPVERILKIGKQRNGPTALIPLIFFPRWVGFGEKAREDEKYPLPSATKPAEQGLLDGGERE